MNFDIDNYKGKYAMHCKTEEEAKDFCHYLHSIGGKWWYGESYYNTTNYFTYRDKTAYNFNKGYFCNIDYYIKRGFKILEWSDFMKKKEFTKKDLRTGDFIKRRNGKVEMLIKEKNVLISQTGWDDFDEIKENLRDFSGDSDWDIIAVKRPIAKAQHNFNIFNYADTHAPLVYKRKEVEEMTLEEVCKALGKEIKIVK